MLYYPRNWSKCLRETTACYYALESTLSPRIYPVFNQDIHAHVGTVSASRKTRKSDNCSAACISDISRILSGGECSNRVINYSVTTNTLYNFKNYSVTANTVILELFGDGEYSSYVIIFIFHGSVSFTKNTSLF